MHRFTTNDALKEVPRQLESGEGVGRSSEDPPSVEAVSYPNVSEDMLQNSHYGGGKPSPPPPSRRSQRNNGRLDRTTIMIIVIIGMTMITQIPVCFVYTFNYFMDNKHGMIEMPAILGLFLHWLLLMNSAADPVIYGLMNPPFKRAYYKFYKTIRYLCRREKPAPTRAESYYKS